MPTNIDFAKLLRLFLEHGLRRAGSYEGLLAHSQPIPLLGTTCRCVTLAGLIRLKRASGRPKDLEAIAELETLRTESGR